MFYVQKNCNFFLKLYNIKYNAEIQDTYTRKALYVTMYAHNVYTASMSYILNCSALLIIKAT